MNFSFYANSNIDNTLKELDSNPKGLGDVEAVKRLAQYGPNALSSREMKWWQIFLSQFNTPFIYLLVGAALLSIFLGQYPDAIVIFAFILINSLLGFNNEYHSHKSLELLKKFIVNKTKVLRNGFETIIEAKDLVPGDICIIEAGDIIPADIRFIETSSLTIDESILTGESVPTDKISGSITEKDIPIYKASNIGFSGTAAISGRGVGVVFGTGQNSAIGRISKLTVETYRESSFEKNISKFSKFILRMIVIIITLLFIINIALKSGKANIFEILLFSVALAVSVVPEALPVVVTIALSKGAIKLAKDKVVVKRLSAVEDLGSVEILCTDKTGTLTENKLTVSDILSDTNEQAVFYATLGNTITKTGEESLDAFDIALMKWLPEEDKIKMAQYEKLDEIPFDPIRRRHTVLIKNKNECILIVRGASESVWNLCKNLPEEKIKEMKSWIAERGSEGKRVITVAKKEIDDGLNCKITEDENGLEFLGLISFIDPIKDTAKDTLEQAKQLGVRIKILTGDSREVAGAVAKAVGLISGPSEVITGDEFEKDKSKEEMFALAEKYNVFARVTPEQKYKIIEVLQSKYEVGFLGEGINDAPALKLANVGIVVNAASDLARDSADVVLLERSLNVIIKGIRDGRAIFENTVKYIKTTLVSNFGNFYTLAIAAIFIPVLPMLPAQILLLNLLSDFPMIAISTDNVDEGRLRRPRSYQVREILFISIILGLVSTVFDFLFFAIFNHPIHPQILQTNWFIGSVLTELALIYSLRTRLPFWKGSRPTTGLIVLPILAGLSTVLLPFTTWGRQYFGFMKPEINSLILIFGIVLVYFLTTEIIKVLYYKNKLNLNTDFDLPVGEQKII